MISYVTGPFGFFAIKRCLAEGIQLPKSMRKYNMDYEDNLVHMRTKQKIQVESDDGSDEDEDDELLAFSRNPHYNVGLLKYFLTTIFPLGPMLSHALILNSEQPTYPDTNAASNLE